MKTRYSQILMSSNGSNAEFFKNGEIGIIIAKFNDLSEGEELSEIWTNQLEEMFDENPYAYKLRFARLRFSIRSEEEAKTLLKETGATLVVWGFHWGNQDVIRVQYTVSGNSSFMKFFGKLVKDKPAFFIKTDSKEEVNLKEHKVPPQSFNTFIENAGDLAFLVQVLLGIDNSDPSFRTEWILSALRGKNQLKRGLKAPFLTNLNWGVLETLWAWCEILKWKWLEVPPPFEPKEVALRNLEHYIPLVYSGRKKIKYDKLNVLRPFAIKGLPYAEGYSQFLSSLRKTSKELMRYERLKS